MKYLPILITGIITLTIIIFLAQNPFLSATPGELSTYHHGLQHNCQKCHTYFKGVPEAKCVTCHPVDKIGADKVKPNKINFPFHTYLKNTNCIECHTEHNADVIPLTSGKFKHSLLKTPIQEQCSTCHIRPADNIHNGFNSECSSCHTTATWKGASFDHQKYFVFDGNHLGKCENCHTDASSFKTYTCYGCHEHSPEKISRKHLKEGISNYENCVKCHRSSNKHGEGGEREGKQRKHEREHEGNDD